jgi:hypothetical protein
MADEAAPSGCGVATEGSPSLSLRTAEVVDVAIDGPWPGSERGHDKRILASLDIEASLRPTPASFTVYVGRPTASQDESASG